MQQTLAKAVIARGSHRRASRAFLLAAGLDRGMRDPVSAGAGDAPVLQQPGRRRAPQAPAAYHRLSGAHLGRRQAARCAQRQSLRAWHFCSEGDAGVPCGVWRGRRRRLGRASRVRSDDCAAVRPLGRRDRQLASGCPGILGRLSQRPSHVGNCAGARRPGSVGRSTGVPTGGQAGGGPGAGARAALDTPKNR